MDRRKTILKFKKVVKMGHIAQRGKEPYTSFLCSNINCFEHACFNFCNRQFSDMDFVRDDAYSLQGFNLLNIDEAKKELLGFVRKTGLGVRKCKPDASLKENQWKIALYICEHRATYSNEHFLAYHFLIQEKDGSWTGKDGFGGELQFFETLPDKIKFTHSLDYKLVDTYAITNPYAEKSESHPTEKEKEV